MKRIVINILQTSLMLGMVLYGISCKKKEKNPEPDAVAVDGKIYHLAFAVDPENQSATFFQQINNLKTGSISFDGLGFQLPSTRTARPYASTDGRYIYSLDYGGGQIYSYRSAGGSSYDLSNQINIQQTIGTTNPRWTLVEPDYALLHNVASSASTNEFDGKNNFIKRKVTANLARIGLGASLSIGSKQEFEVLLDNASEGVYISRIDAPAVAHGKAYYGFARTNVDLNDPSTTKTHKYTNAQTLVVDYPSLANPKIITTTKAAGATNGYRTPCSHVAEDGNVYQLVSSNGANDLKILRINSSGYDESYEFNLSQITGKKVGSNGWFYIGNGIGYMPFFDSSLGAASTGSWFVARIDLYNNKATVLNLPSGLWLQQYQYSVMQEGKFVMALHPKDGNGNIYFLDPNSDSADAFEVGAEIKIAANSCYIGIF
jgi:hypothetical protein